MYCELMRFEAEESSEPSAPDLNWANNVNSVKLIAQNIRNIKCCPLSQSAALASGCPGIGESLKKFSNDCLALFGVLKIPNQNSQCKRPKISSIMELLCFEWSSLNGFCFPKSEQILLLADLIELSEGTSFREVDPLDHPIRQGSSGM